MRLSTRPSDGGGQGSDDAEPLPAGGGRRQVAARAAGPVPAQTPPASSLQQTAVKGACIGALASVVVVSAAVAVNGGGLGSLGAGVMVAGFDGIPFGAMIGAMVHFMRHPDDQ